MANARHAAAFARVAARAREAQETPPEAVPTAPPSPAVTLAGSPAGLESPVGGAWTKGAISAMGRRLDEITRGQAEDIAKGVLPIRVPVDRILDPLGTDRVLGLPDEGEDGFEALVENIRRRGLRTPLRVRPTDPEWRPDPDRPFDIGETTFELQSGRRRLEACRRLGLDPLVFVSAAPFASDDPRIDDLTERYFENAIRKNLTTFERLYSVGLIARTLKVENQGQVAQILGCSEAMVSRGVGVYDHRDELEGLGLDLGSATFAQLDAAFRKIRSAKPRSSDAERMARYRERRRVPQSLPFRSKPVFGGVLELELAGTGAVTLRLTAPNLDPRHVRRIASFIERLDREAAKASPEAPGAQDAAG